MVDLHLGGKNSSFEFSRFEVLQKIFKPERFDNQGQKIAMLAGENHKDKYTVAFWNWKQLGWELDELKSEIVKTKWVQY